MAKQSLTDTSSARLNASVRVSTPRAWQNSTAFLPTGSAQQGAPCIFSAASLNRFEL